MRFEFVISGGHNEADHLDDSVERVLSSTAKTLRGMGYNGGVSCDFGRGAVGSGMVFVDKDETPALTTTIADLPSTRPLTDPADFTVPVLKVRLKWLSGRGLTKVDCDQMIQSELDNKNRDTAVYAIKQTRDVL
jgi:hypothetical protein